MRWVWAHPPMPPVHPDLIAGYDVSDQFTAIEDLLAQQAPMATVLRAAVLFSLTAGGIKPKQLEGFKREFLQVYGYHHIPLFMALAELDLLAKAPARSSTFPALRKALRLLVDDIDEQAPSDISYVYSGYAPLSIRLVQCIAQKPVVLSDPVRDGAGVPKAHGLAGWKGFEDVVRAIPGAMFDEAQQADEAEGDTAGRGECRLGAGRACVGLCSRPTRQPQSRTRRERPSSSSWAVARTQKLLLCDG